MFSPDVLRELLDHMEWADAEVWSVVLNTEGASVDRAVHGTLLHVHQTQHAYLNMWTGRPQVSGASEDVDTLVALHEWARPCYSEMRVFLAEASMSALEAQVPEEYHQRLEEHLGRGRASVTLGASVFDVVTHTTHHRGQTNARLRQLGGEPPFVDYVGWVWCGRPAAKWSGLNGLT